VEEEMTKTPGENSFEEYMNLHRLPFEYEKTFPGKSRKPDYCITTDREYLFEVKDFTQVPKQQVGAGDPYCRIRQNIDKARKKFKDFAEWPCCLVLYSNCVQVDVNEPMIVFGSMEGDFGVSMQVDSSTGSCVPDSVTPAFLGRGKMIQEQWASAANTTISALITLRYVRPEGASTSVVCVIVWENRFARHPLPRSMFNGPLDVRYWIENNQVKKYPPNQAL
jgi:hypothetical protein